MYDVLIIGGGPIGLACGIEAKRAGLSHLILEKGALLNSFVHYPTNLELFSTPDLLEIGGHPFPCRGHKPTREEALEYYRKVALAEKLNIHLYERVLRVDGSNMAFEIHTSRGVYHARKVVVATGFFDVPNRLNVPGEELSKVTHYYREPYPYAFRKIAVIGAKNSAAKAALDCHRHDAEVTLIVRGPAISDKVKYWIKPALENRIREGAIRAYFNSTVERITPEHLHIRTPEGPVVLENDFVLAMTGYQPDYTFLRKLGIALADDPYQTPVYHPETMETNRKGIYLAGVVCGGKNTSIWFIENSRIHARLIADHIVQELMAASVLRESP